MWNKNISTGRPPVVERRLVSPMERILIGSLPILLIPAFIYSIRAWSSLLHRMGDRCCSAWTIRLACVVATAFSTGLRAWARRANACLTAACSILVAPVMLQLTAAPGLLKRAATVFFARFSVSWAADVWQTVYGKGSEFLQRASLGVSGGGVRKAYNKDTRAGKGRKISKENRGRRSGKGLPDDDGDDVGEGSSDGEPNGSRRWACPFFRLNPSRFIECGVHGFPRFSDLTQHLSRAHCLSNDKYCSICWTFFGSLTERDQHVANCTNRQPREIFYKREFDQLKQQIKVPVASLRAMYADTFYINLSLCEMKWLFIWRQHFSTIDPSPPNFFYMDHLITEVAQLLRNRNQPTLQQALLISSLWNPVPALTQVQDAAYQSAVQDPTHWLPHARDDVDESQVGQNTGSAADTMMVISHIAPPAVATAAAANPNAGEPLDFLGGPFPPLFEDFDPFFGMPDEE